MKRIIPLIFLLVCMQMSYAKEYGYHEPMKILTVKKTPSGKKHALNLGILDGIINDLSYHAKNYPPKFDSENDKNRASNDVKTLSGMLDLLVKSPKANPDLLKRSSLINSIGHNLNIPGAARKADRDFRNLLAQDPNDAVVNYMYGVFLGNSNQGAKALPYLQKAIALGHTNAYFSLGMAYLMQKDTKLALKNFEIYKNHKPNDKNVNNLIEAVKAGNIQFKVK